MAMISFILSCLGLNPDHDHMSKHKSQAYHYTDEKIMRFSTYYDHNDPEIHGLAEKFVHILLQADRVNSNTHTQLRECFFGHTAVSDDQLHTNNWYESLAAAILERLQAALQAGAELSATVEDAVERADLAAQAVGFVKEHPVYCTLIAMGVLVMIAPWVLEAVGFAEAGIVEGKTECVVPHIVKGKDLYTLTIDH